mgnify:CR=1 FL=1
MRPMIGITTNRHVDGTGAGSYQLAEAYVQAILMAGGVPVLLPSAVPPEESEALVHGLSGVLLSGGGDVEPSLYGESDRDQAYDMDPQRDAFEMGLLQGCLRLFKPVLGICRGMQVMNVALGGTLWADVLTEMPSASRHDFHNGHARDYLAHAVQVTAGSHLSRILGEQELQVNSLHHQGVRRVAPPLRAVAFAPDGLVEGIELDGHPFALGVQWHPECLPSSESQRALLAAFVAAASQTEAS